MVEPKYEVNVGHVARVMKNFGFATLILVKPKISTEVARKFAAHGVDVLQQAEFREEFASLRKEFDLLVGTTAVSATGRSNLVRVALSPNQMAEILNKTTSKACLVMGRDTTGLKREELAQCDIVVRIETGRKYTTMNISHALAIILYELQRRRYRMPKGRTASSDVKDLALTYCLKLAERSGYPSHKRRLLRDAVRRLLGRGDPSPREISLFIGLMRRALLALDRLTTGKES